MSDHGLQVTSASSEETRSRSNALQSLPRPLVRIWSAVRRSKRTTAAVIAEACDLLTGRAVDRYVRRGEPVPHWAWLNALTHRPPESVASLAADHPGETWAGVTGQIALELSRVRRAEASSLQREVFLPAELDALADRGGTPEAVLWALRRHLAGDGLRSYD